MKSVHHRYIRSNEFIWPLNYFYDCYTAKLLLASHAIKPSQWALCLPLAHPYSDILEPDK